VVSLEGGRGKGGERLNKYCCIALDVVDFVRLPDDLHESGHLGSMTNMSARANPIGRVYRRRPGPLLWPLEGVPRVMNS